MEIQESPLPGVRCFTPRVFADDRGHFFESFSAQAWDRPFVQENQSFSHAGVLRGLHKQAAPHEQGKLVRVVSGAVFDVAVDVRPGSPTFGRWVGETLSADNRRQLWIPEGFLHGFYALEDSVLLYKMTAAYAPQAETPVRWDDADLGIAWPLRGEPTVSEKDRAAPAFCSVFTPA